MHVVESSLTLECGRNFGERARFEGITTHKRSNGNDGEERLRTMKWIALTLAGLSITATLAAAGDRADGRSRDRTHAVRDGGGREHALRQRGERPRHWRANARDVLRDLDLSDAQRELARREAEALRPAAQALRDEARAIVAAARTRARTGDRDGARTEARDALRGLRTRARADFTPSGRALVASLTPEQRARMEARSAARGRTFDADRASERVGRWLARPRTEGRHPLEAKTR